MRQRLLWKLLIGHFVPIFAIFSLVVWQAVDKRAAEYYRELTERFHVAPLDAHNRFLEAIHQHMFWGVFAALTFTLLFTYLLTTWVLHPLLKITDITKKVADGNYSERVNVVSRYEGGQLADAFNHMAENLETIERLRKNMVADISHELRTPLTNLRGYLEGLSDSVIPPDKETFQMLEQEVLRLVNLVDDLQQLARADAARAFLDCQKLSLHELLGQIMDLYRPNFQEKQIEVQWRLDPGSDLVTADRDKLLQAIRNLADNAWKYTPRCGSVTISAQRSGDGIKTVFTNSGAVIAEKDIPYLFERFFRADRSRSRDAGGAGIGLAIVKELIEAHGGTVGAGSDESGTSVWFTLPDSC
ncbi:signal transduction histidine-protein kinase BaeS [Geobacter sp. OR-1]|uniref:sensor histidine kinase n=1 Tax=Geobacter sp. OR-1 TaxID=1266765 RepID=UPI000541E8FC|nr:ATP-binding protein [Geobacter sp. OR-1]GAM08012.1 signal transduction histidine-protein kinase BaeS [Geobacter sp. OR-1]